MAVPLPSFFSVTGFIFSDVPEICQGIQSLIHHKHHISTVSAVSAVRSAVGNIQLPPEGYMSVAALSGTDKDLRSVSKHR
jgi:hypothetical protein